MLKIDSLVYSHEGMDDYFYELEANKGEVVAILGESGSGKSTLLDLIAGFLEETSGNILLSNSSLNHLPVEKRPISILFQKYNLFEHLSVEKNIVLGLLKKHNTEAVKEVLDEVGLSGMATRKVSTLSGGQQQRVALARVLLRDKPILLLDEPFTGLDSKTREQMLALVKSITKEKNLYTIMITHDIEDSNKIAEHLYRMSNRRLVKIS